MGFVDTAPQPPSMLQHYLKIAVRNLLKRKFYSLINMAGLAIGMTCCLLIALYVQHELSYEQYHTKHDRIFRAVQYFGSPEDARGKALAPEDYQVWGCAPLGPALAADFPQVEKIVQFMSPVSLLLESGDKRLQQDDLVCMDSTAFDVFSWKLLQGDRRTALTAPFSIVLTQTVAEKIFGNENPVGKTLKVDNRDQFTVTGVVADVPSNSQIHFTGLISMATARKGNAEIFDWWGYVDFYTYFLLKDNAAIRTMQSAVPAFLKRHLDNPGYNLAFESLDDAYLHSRAGRQPGPSGSMQNVYLFSCVGFIILLIACVNFMNLSTARSLERAKEVGVRKVLGVQPGALRRQFLLESILIAVLAGAVALLLTRFGLPVLSQLSGKAIGAESLSTLKGLAAVGVMAIGTGLLAGTYPAWFLSRFRPVAVLKGMAQPGRGTLSLRKVLVVFQFVLSVTLIAATAIVYAQLKFLNQHDLGFQKDQMLVLNFEGDEQVQQNIETIKNSLAGQPGVLSVAASRAVPGEFLPNAGTGIQGPDGSMQDKGLLIYEIDFDFIPALNIQLAAGRNYSRQHPADSTQSMIINEAAARMYGYINSRDAVGKKFEQWGRTGTIIGVVKDFNFRSLHSAVEPLTLRYGMPESLNRILVRIQGGQVAALVAGLEKTWKKLVPHRPFLYHFLDQSFSEQYEADQHFGSMFILFSCLAIFIACLGLFGLATFTMQQRTKEIGIRKVLGASVSSVVLLMSRDFLKLVAIAILISVPLCIWVMKQWLNDFAYRVTISPGTFAITAALVLLVAFLTISWQSIRASLMNPVNCLRNE